MIAISISCARQAVWRLFWIALFFDSTVVAVVLIALFITPVIHLSTLKD
jgi:hypothetical protein